MRYFICDVVGSGQRGAEYRPAIAGRALIPHHPSGHPLYGHPKYRWCLVASRAATGQTPIGSEVSNDAELKGQRVDDVTLRLLKYYGLDVKTTDAFEVLTLVRAYLA